MEKVEGVVALDFRQRAVKEFLACEIIGGQGNVTDLNWFKLSRFHLGGRSLVGNQRRLDLSSRGIRLRHLGVYECRNRVTGEAAPAHIYSGKILNNSNFAIKNEHVRGSST